MRKHLNKIVGQTLLKRELEFYLNGYEAVGFFPPSVFSGSRGQGKTMIVKAVAAELAEINKKKGIVKGKMFLSINSSELKNGDTLFDKVMPLLAQEGDITLFLDETDALDYKVQCALLSLLVPDSNFESKYYLVDGTCYNVDHRKFTFIGAASSFSAMHPDLIDRLKRFSTQEYSEDDLKQIMRNRLPEIEFEEVALDNLVSSLRSSPRHAVQRSQDLKLMGIHRFGDVELNKIKTALNIYPLGLYRDEISVLKVLQRGPATLTEISSRLNRTKDSVMNDLEVFLKSKELIKTAGAKGRVLTIKGLEVLAEIDKINS